MGVKKIGVLTSGGDAPGMNAAIRSVVRSAIHNNLEVVGVRRGYAGLITGDVIPLDRRSVSNIVNQGGTILKTDRSEEFKTKEGQKKAVDIIQKNKIDCLIVIGGNGSLAGANILYKDWKINCIGVSSTIDNDLNGTDLTIGADTAVNTALEAIDKIRSTATSMERIFLVEVMGRDYGYIALRVALAAGAEDVLIPERSFDCKKLCRNIVEGSKKGKVSWIIIVAEGAGSAIDISKEITASSGLETRVVVLGHIQRGGIPTANDRILAARFGAKAVDLALEGNFGKTAGIQCGQLVGIDLAESIKKKPLDIDSFYKLINILT